MPTLKQKKLAKAVVDSLSSKKTVTKESLLVSVGYSELTADRNANAVFTSSGVVEELKTYGFDVDSAKKVVGTILTNGENDTVKLKAADMIFKVGGTYAAEKHMNLNVNVEADSKLDSLIEQLEDEIDAGT